MQEIPRFLRGAGELETVTGRCPMWMTAKIKDPCPYIIGLLDALRNADKD